MSITRRRLLGSAAACAVVGSTPAVSQAGVTLSVLYSYPGTFKDMQTEIARRFMAERPDVRIEFEAPLRDYEEMVQQVLRAAMTSGLPDVAFHGMHRTRLLAERNLIAALDPLIAAEPNWPALGYPPSMVSLAQIGSKVYGLPFSISIPLVFYNVDLVRKAGGDPDNLPTTWAGILDLARRIKAVERAVMGIYFEYYAANNNWTYHALVQSQGGRMMSEDERELGFTGPAGLEALRILRQIGETGMVDMPDTQAYSSFNAGQIGILVASSSRITQLDRAIGGRFAFRTAPIPMPSAEGKVPAGGNAAMIHTRDPLKQKAAWDYVKFATGPIGQTVMVRNSGYLPGNTLALERPELLRSFYEENPNHRAPVTQIPRVTAFYTFPGENSVKIPTVIRDHLQSVVTLKRTPEQALADMARDVRTLLAS